MILIPLVGADSAIRLAVGGEEDEEEATDFWSIPLVSRIAPLLLHYMVERRRTLWSELLGRQAPRCVAATGGNHGRSNRGG